MSKSRVHDQKARQRIVEDLDRTFLVEAGAGSGKTKSLVDRMLALLIAGKCQIQTLAAVTFTRKAAAELRGRFQTELESEVRTTKNTDVRSRLENALQNLEQCYIGTIHSFCANLLRERPIEVSLDPEFEEMEEIEDALYREKCWYEYLAKARLEDGETVRALDYVGLAPEDLRDAFVTICLFPEVELIAGSDRKPDFLSYASRLEDFLDRARRRVPFEEPEKGFDQLQSVLRRCFMREKILGFDDHRLLMETFELLERDLSIKKSSWPNKDEAESFKREFDLFREGVVRPANREWREYRHSIILSFLKPAEAYFALRRRAQSRVNFEDLLLLASRLLRDNPEVRRYFGRKYTHILVDEFQDTDPIQAEVLLYLTGTDDKEPDWRKLTPRPGSLFLVGDPKQSIFRFRRADIDTYNLVKAQIERAGGGVLPLTANFRSMNSLGKWVNPVFKNAFPADFTPVQAAYAPLSTLRPEVRGTQSGVFKITVPRMERHNQALIAQYDAGAISDYIQWACRGNLQLARSRKERERGLEPQASPSDFMLLFRYKKNMAVYARALEERGIPFEITGGGAFAESEEIREIVNVAEALNDPENPVYTVAVLRGLFFGASDNELLDFKRRGGRFTFLQTFDDSGADQSDRVKSSLRVLRQWWEWTQKYPVSAAFEKIFESSGIINYLASGEMGSSKAGNLFKLLEIVRARERESSTSLSVLVAFLDSLTTVFEIEETSLTPARSDAVRMMNLHKAKGLEAPVVFLANPVGMKTHDPDRHISRTEKAGPLGHFLFAQRGWYRPKILSQPVGWDKAAEEETAYQQAEEMRLMYVAATRARNILAISTYAENLGDRRAWAVLDDALGAVPELPIPEDREVAKRKRLDVSEEELAEVRKNLQEKAEAASKPGYRVETVTSLSKEGLVIPPRRKGGLGMSRGRVVHAVLDAMGRALARGDARSLDINGLIENAMAAEEIIFSEKTPIRALVDSIRKSVLWERALKAERRLFEVPFALKARGKDLELVGNPVVLLSGVVDLVFKEEGDWVIADYKTDEIVGDLQSYIDYYAPQVRLYSRFWAEITGESVKECGLYFTSIGRWIPV